MKIGDEVIVSDKNPNHLGYGVSAYAGMKGIVTDVWEDNAFCINCGTSILVVPMVIYGVPKTYWIWLNGKLIKHDGIKQKFNLPNNKSVKVKMDIADKILIGLLFVMGLVVIFGMIISEFF